MVDLVHAFRLQLFPRTYEEAIQQAQEATQRAMDDECTLMEVEFPTASLASVSGDADGANEMNFSMNYLRRYSRIFEILGKAEATRIFFPEESVKQLQTIKQCHSSDM